MTAAIEVATASAHDQRVRLSTILAWELEKLTAQWRTRVAFFAALLGPFAFAVAMKASQSVPADTLFGRWVHDSGYAIALVVLGFCGSWGFPLLVSLVAGDIFSAEDNLRTWPTVLTRSAAAGTIYTAKLLATALYAVLIVLILAVSSLTAGLLLVGGRALVTLSGTTVEGRAAVVKVLLSWSTAILPTLAFAALAVFISVLTRNSLAGIITPTVLGFLLQLLLMLQAVSPIRDELPSTAYLGWHGLFTDPQSTTSLVHGQLSCACYVAVFIAASAIALVRRDEANR